jgi:hypothetical protein
MSASASPRSRLTKEEQEALERLFAIARRDTGQSRKVADFLLAWWNAEECGGFDLVTLWSVDREIAQDMQTVFALIARVQSYPDNLDYGQEFELLVKRWRPATHDPSP